MLIAAAALVGCGRSSADPSPGTSSGAGTHTHADGTTHSHGGGTHSHGPAGATDPEKAKKLRAKYAYLGDIGGVHLSHGYFDEAIRSFTEAIKTAKEAGDDNALFYYSLAKAYQNKGDQAKYRSTIEECIRVYTALFNDPNRKNVKDFYCEQLSNVYSEIGDQKKALEWADQLGVEGPANSQTLRAKARLYVRLGMTAKALAVLEDAEKNAATPAERDRAAYEISEVLIAMKRPQDAAKRLETLSDSASDSSVRARAKELLFGVYKATGQLDKLKLRGGQIAPPGNSSPNRPPTGGGN